MSAVAAGNLRSELRAHPVSSTSFVSVWAQLENLAPVGAAACRSKGPEGPQGKKRVIRNLVIQVHIRHPARPAFEDSPFAYMLLVRLTA